MRNDGDWIGRTGVHTVRAAAHNYDVVDVANRCTPMFNGTRRLGSRWDLEMHPARQLELDDDDA